MAFLDSIDPPPFRARLRSAGFATALVFSLSGCASDDPGPASDTGAGTKADDAGSDTDASTGATDTTGPTADGCEGPLSLRSVRDAAEDVDATCHDWLENVRGRVAHNGGASMAMWSLRTESSVGLFVSANHVLGNGWYPDPTLRQLSLRNQDGIGRLSFPSATGGFDENVGLSPMYELFNPAIPAGQTAENLLPRHDYYVAVVDGQVLEEGLLAPSFEPLTETAPAVYDPTMATLQDATWAEPMDNDDVLLLGYPQAEFPDDGGFAIGVVLSDDAAIAAVKELAAAGDSEGDIAYDPQAEFLVRGTARSGMSGGGAFDRDGRLLGVLVRASEAQIDGVEITRVVRMSWIVSGLGVAYDEANDDTRSELEPLLGLELP